MTEQAKFPRCPKCDKVMVATYQYRKKKWVKIGCSCEDCKEMVWLND